MPKASQKDLSHILVSGALDEAIVKKMLKISLNGNQNKKEITEMSKNEMLAKLELLNEWERIIEEAKAEAELIKNEIKAEMDERELEEMVVGSYVVRYKTISNSRFDSTAFKKYNVELYKAFLKQVASKRFSVSY